MLRPGLALLAAFAAATPAAAQNCAGALDIKGSALTGTWTVVKGAAQTGGAPMAGGSDKVAMQATGGGLTLEIDGFRIPLNRVQPGVAPWTWTKTADAAVDSEEFEVVLGCDNDALARYEGTQKVAGQIVTWRLMVETASDAYVLWSFSGPPASSGLFALDR
jgi:hypothetical protein